MSHPCQYNVYLRERGAKGQKMLASFAHQVDAVNWAFDCSRGRYRRDDATMVVLDKKRHVFRKFRQGVTIK